MYTVVTHPSDRSRAQIMPTRWHNLEKAAETAYFQIMPESGIIRGRWRRGITVYGVIRRWRKLAANFLPLSAP